MDDYSKADDSEAYFPEGTIHEDEFFYTGDYNFVWDKAKNEKNLRDHGIDFRTAALVFNDPYAQYYRIISARAAVKKEIEAYKRNRAKLEKRA